MNFLKIFVVIAFAIINWFVLSFQPSVHPQFVLEDTTFKVSKYYQEPKTTETINILKLGQAKPQQKQIKTLTANNSTQAVQREVNIQPSEFYQYASGVGTQETPITEYKEITAPEPETRREVQPRTLTKREETIAWNQWRSDLQNQIMLDSPFEAPFGTLITYSFRVSNNRQVSNIKVKCSNWGLTDKAKEIITPLIKSYSGKEPLAFPAGSERKFIDFKGAYLIWFETSYSSADDFSDFERVQSYE